jgi:magnesium chelatase family protein
MLSRDVETYCVTTPEADETLKQAMTSLGLSARAFDRILKVARTIADLDESDLITRTHMAEAVQYRNLDRPYWNG